MFDYYSLICNLISNNITVSTMESCTGGMICDCITDVENCSRTLIGGYVTYTNEQKIRCGVSKEIIDKYGVYSKECANNMAEVCRNNTGSMIGIGVTGTLGNIDSNNSSSQIGKIYFCICGEVDRIVKEIELTEFELNLSRIKQKTIVVSEIFECLEDFILKGMK